MQRVQLITHHLVLFPCGWELHKIGFIGIRVFVGHKTTAVLQTQARLLEELGALHIPVFQIALCSVSDTSCPGDV